MIYMISSSLLLNSYLDSNKLIGVSIGRNFNLLIKSL